MLRRLDRGSILLATLGLSAVAAFGLLFGPAALGGLFVVIGLGLCFWLFILVVTLGSDVMLFLPVPESAPYGLMLLLALAGIVLIALGVVLIGLDPRVSNEGVKVPR